jgi:hypothetical protein
MAPRDLAIVTTEISRRQARIRASFTSLRRLDRLLTLSAKFFACSGPWLHAGWAAAVMWGAFPSKGRKSNLHVLDFGATVFFRNFLVGGFDKITGNKFDPAGTGFLHLPRRRELQATPTERSPIVRHDLIGKDKVPASSRPRALLCVPCIAALSPYEVNRLTRRSIPWI